MAMTLRADKGAILSWNEMDANFRACFGIHNLLHVYDKQAKGVQGGGFTSGAWRTRVLNTTKTNSIDGASLASNQITLPAGSYFITAKAPALGVFSHTARLQKISPSSETILIGSAGYSDTSVLPNDYATISGVFTLAGASVIELQHICQTTRATNGFGTSSPLLDTDIIYSELLLWKVA